MKVKMEIDVEDILNEMEDGDDGLAGEVKAKIIDEAVEQIMPTIYSKIEVIAHERLTKFFLGKINEKTDKILNELLECETIYTPFGRMKLDDYLASLFSGHDAHKATKTLIHGAVEKATSSLSKSETEKLERVKKANELMKEIIKLSE